MLKRPHALLALAGVVALVAAAPSGATKPAAGCPPPFDQQTFEEALEVAHETGVPASDEELLAYFAVLDTNGDEMLCFMNLPDTPGIPSFAVNIVDNTANVPH